MPYTAYIQLQVKDQQGVDAHFQIKKSTSLRKLMDEYCRRFVPQGSHVRFLVQGEVIAQEDTADKLGLKEGDLIIAVLDEDRAISYGGSGDSGDEAAEQPAAKETEEKKAATKAEPAEEPAGAAPLAWPAAEAAVAAWTRARSREIDGTARERSEWLQSLDSEF